MTLLPPPLSPSIDQTEEWRALAAQAAAERDITLRQLFTADPKRFERFSFQHGDMLLDLSRQRLSAQTLGLLLKLARAADLEGWRERMFAGVHINSTEDRAVLHTALRLPREETLVVDGLDVVPQVHGELDRMEAMVQAVRKGTWRGATGETFRYVVNIGIGGSDLGPRMVVDALAADHEPGLDVKFVSNVDGADLMRVLAGCEPARTLIIVASKTFTTQETMANAASARHWLQQALGEKADWAAHFVALSAAPKAVAAFGLKADRRLTFWDWVGGRYSLWSSIGFPIALSIGMEKFRDLLAGAHAMDEHFRTAPLIGNLPVLMALAGIWNINFLGFNSLAVLPYDQGLGRLPAYLQQADMESNGKSTDRWGRSVGYATGPLVFGEPGTNGQHAFYQLLHQGTPVVPADFILPLESRYPLGQHHAMLTANVLAQAEALMLGRTLEEVTADLRASGMSDEAVSALAPHKVFSGNRPSTLIALPILDPYHLGMLIALYEHKIFCQGVIWGVNSFDQWGVELGKRLAGPILEELTDPSRQPHHDSATSALIALVRRATLR
ncbi:glucose-6-phosphate isomerase [Ferrovibrio sp.]|uniref:glucose-6-phosphate isomerase n=1 Tax=Ferrovibrio sp. TaxID=1917215 RepID=UPI003D280584